MSDYEISEIDLKNATDDLYAQLNHNTNLMRRERLPDDPPVSLEETTQNFKTIPPFVGFKAWKACQPGSPEIIGFAAAIWLNTEENQHLVQMELDVLPEHRQRGLGRRLLRGIVDTARQQNRRLIVTHTNSRSPGGAAFLARVGAKRGLEAHTNQLDLNDLNRELVKKWLAEVPARAPGYELGFWDGEYPEEQIEAISELWELTNQQPLGDMEIEDSHYSPEMLRQMERNLFARGQKRWTYYVVDRESEMLVGYTELSWHPGRSHIRSQGMTGVFPEHRNQGLGRWLKAVMLARVLKEEPPVRFIRTGNANDNAPMLKINNALGFKPYYASTLWQLEVEKAAEYLS